MIKPATRIDAARVARLLGEWRRPGVPGYNALSDALGELIDGAQVPAATVLPSQRSLAAALGISRGTVVRAYEQLQESGRLSSHRGSGSVIRRSGNFGGLEGRMASFSGRPLDLDLSSGALPGSPLIGEVMEDVGRLLSKRYLDTWGTFPPAFRSCGR
ncbi:GntR family transcriptional regulator [Actinomyces sp.]|uniref:GntR family transcriptional regulator n=1 Tax=Actinomyces sp. TaxID=29317 RepID=UPI0034C64C20